MTRPSCPLDIEGPASIDAVAGRLNAVDEFINNAALATGIESFWA